MLKPWLLQRLASMHVLVVLGRSVMCLYTLSINNIPFFFFIIFFSLYLVLFSFTLHYFALAHVTSDKLCKCERLSTS